jgi:hypothetical protein
VTEKQLELLLFNLVFAFTGREVGAIWEDFSQLVDLPELEWESRGIEERSQIEA